MIARISRSAVPALAVLAALACASVGAAAQRPPDAAKGGGGAVGAPHPDSAARARRQAARPAWRLLRVAKWSTLAAAVGSGGYGLWAQREADRTHDRLERICAADPARCGGTTIPDGEYADPALERAHRDADVREDRALLALIGSYAGLASSIALFVLDMRESGLPPNELYEPAGITIEPRPGGGASLRVRLEPPW